jgi:vacuolar protein sorting-associated protein 13A/C
MLLQNGEYLDSCISLGSDCWYSASEDDHVYLVRENAPENDGLQPTLNQEIPEDIVEKGSSEEIVEKESSDRSTEFIIELQVFLLMSSYS